MSIKRNIGNYTVNNQPQKTLIYFTFKVCFMNFSELMDEITALFDRWKKDEEMIKQFGDKEGLQKYLIECVQYQIESNFKILTQEQWENIPFNY